VVEGGDRVPAKVIRVGDNGVFVIAFRDDDTVRERVWRVLEVDPWGGSRQDRRPGDAVDEPRRTAA
jgi:hypothetical protein